MLHPFKCDRETYSDFLSTEKLESVSVVKILSKELDDGWVIRMSSTWVKQAKRLVLSGVIMGVGLWAMPVQAQVSEGQVRALVQALRDAAQQRAPGNNGLVSEWQILPENIPRWSRRCTGQALTSAQFEASTPKAREILVCVMRDVLRDEYTASGNSETLAVRRAASWWMTGNPNRYNSDSTAAYTQNVLSFYQKQRTGSQAAEPSPLPKPPTVAQAAQPAPQPLPKPPTVAQAAQPAPQPSPQSSARASSSTLVSNAQVGRLVEALRLAAQQRAPGNNGLVSEWQILPENIPRWSRRCTGQALTSAQFEASTPKAREILVCVMRDVLREEYTASGNSETLAVRRAASWWMTGNPNRYNSDSTAAYTQNVWSFYQKQRTGSQAAEPTPLPKPPTVAQAAQPAPQPLPKPPTVAQAAQPAPQPSPQSSARASSSTLVSNAQVGRLVEALRLAAQQRAPGNNGLVSEWQILPENIPRWSKQCHTQELTPSQFEASPLTARAILVCVMRDVLSEQYKASGNNESLAVRRTAALWMTGDANQYNSDSTAPYTQNVLAFYQQSSSGSQAQQPATPPPPAPSGQAAHPTASSTSAAQISNAQVGRLVEALREVAPET